MQQQPCAAGISRKGPVVRAFAEGGVANDGVGEVVEVAADLVPPAALRVQFDQCIAAGRVAVIGERQLYGSQPPPAGAGFLWQIFGARIDPFCIVRLALQRVVDNAFLAWPATHDGEIALLYLLCGESFRQRACTVTIQCEDEHPGSAAIKAMYGRNLLADLVAQHLHGELGFMAIEYRAMHEKTGGLVDHHKVFITMEDGQHQEVVPACGNSPST